MEKRSCCLPLKRKTEVKRRGSAGRKSEEKKKLGRGETGEQKEGEGSLAKFGFYLLTVRKPRGRKQRKTKESKEVVFFGGGREGCRELK